MRPRSDSFEVILLGLVLALVFMLKTVWDILFEAWLIHYFERQFGLTVAEMIERFGAVGFPILGAVAIVWLLYRYIGKEFQKELDEQLRPKIMCAFSADTPGCVRHNSIITA